MNQPIFDMVLNMIFVSTAATVLQLEMTVSPKLFHHPLENQRNYQLIINLRKNIVMGHFLGKRRINLPQEIGRLGCSTFV